MRLPTLFKQNSNKSYGYSPRYYSERKERIERLKREKEASTADQSLFRTSGPKSFREDWRRQKSQAMEKIEGSVWRLFLSFCYWPFILPFKWAD